MKNKLSWTHRCEDGVKQEVRVEITAGGMTWQFKRADQERWDYDQPPTPADWDELEDILGRRAQRGRSLNLLASVRKLRGKTDA